MTRVRRACLQNCEALHSPNAIFDKYMRDHSKLIPMARFSILEVSNIHNAFSVPEKRLAGSYGGSQIVMNRLGLIAVT